jgi:hypothetical protein
MKATSPRRQLIMAVLLGLAMVGAVVRHWAPNPSLARDIGTLLLVLWLPAIGNLVAFVIAQVHRRRAAGRTFDPAAPFTPHAQIELTALEAALPPLAPDERRCALVVGSEGFSARAAAPLAPWLAAGGVSPLAVQFLRPELALPRLLPGTECKLLVARTLLASGRVLEAGRPAAAVGT